MKVPTLTQLQDLNRANLLKVVTDHELSMETDDILTSDLPQEIYRKLKEKYTGEKSQETCKEEKKLTQFSNDISRKEARAIIEEDSLDIDPDDFDETDELIDEIRESGAITTSTSLIEDAQSSLGNLSVSDEDDDEDMENREFLLKIVNLIKEKDGESPIRNQRVDWDN
jgi:hypothetical protein